MVDGKGRIIASPRLQFSPAWLAASLLFVSMAGFAANSVKENQQQLEAVRSKISGLQKTLDRDRREQDALRSGLETAERRVAELAGTADALRRQINEQNRQLRKTGAEQAQAEANLKSQQNALSRQIRASYVIGRRAPTRLMLNQDTSDRLTRILTFYDYLNRARIDRIGSIQDQVQKLDALLRRLRAENQKLQGLRSQHLGTLTVLEASRAERAGMVREIAARIRNDESELKHLKAGEKELSGLLSKLRTALADVPADLGKKPFAGQKGRLTWPLQGKLLARFGDPKAGGRLKWNGLWIAGKEGDTVRSIARGRVAYVGWMHRYGLIVVLEHEGGYYSLYGHNQNAVVGIGDWVQPGDPIASAGLSGGYESAGVYFELRKGTEAVDPRPWLKS